MKYGYLLLGFLTIYRQILLESFLISYLRFDPLPHLIIYVINSETRSHGARIVVIGISSVRTRTFVIEVKSTLILEATDVHFVAALPASSPSPEQSIVFTLSGGSSFVFNLSFLGFFPSRFVNNYHILIFYGEVFFRSWLPMPHPYISFPIN